MSTQSGTRPALSGLALDDEPQDNITPWKVTAGLRINDQRETWWAGYYVRSVGKVSRVSPLLDESPFLSIAAVAIGLLTFTYLLIAPFALATQ